MVCRLSSPIVATLASLLASSALAARILCVFPDPSRSHAITYQPLTRALAARGHHVTVVSSFPLDAPVANYTDVALTHGYYGVDRFFDNIYALRYASLPKVLKCIWQHFEERCNDVLSDSRVQQLINSKDQHFDLVILEYLLYECFVGFALRFHVPFVLINANRGTHWIWDVVGNSSPFAYVPSSTFSFSDRMTFPERFLNTLEPTLVNIGKNLLMPHFDSLMRKYFNDTTMPNVKDIVRNASLLLVATHEILDYPRPSVQAIVSIGGIHVKPPKKLPNDLQEFLDDAQDGAVYFSLGSTLTGSFMPTSLRNTFVAGFSRLKLRILWRWDGDTIPDLPANVKVVTWLPQGDVLAHPNVRAFLTQGGYTSMQESVYHGVPIIGIPIYGDQFWNVRLAQESGFGIRLDLDNVTAESVMWAVNSLNDQESYQENARRASAKFRDNLQSPLEKAVYWTEYVIRHKGAPHLRVAALDLTWYQYLMLDVVLVVVVVPIVLLVAMRVLIRGRSSARVEEIS